MIVAYARRRLHTVRTMSCLSSPKDPDGQVNLHMEGNPEKHI